MKLLFMWKIYYNFVKFYIKYINFIINQNKETMIKLITLFSLFLNFLFKDKNNNLNLFNILNFK
jgi:hypothetical protein